MLILLKEWRRRRFLTQGELAERSGVGVATIARIEAGRGARPPTLRKLAATLHLEPGQLVLDDEEPGRGKAAA
jgi:transcriptional regulator with XRE-family HTH domain